MRLFLTIHLSTRPWFLVRCGSVLLGSFVIRNCSRLLSSQNRLGNIHLALKLLVLAFRSIPFVSKVSVRKASRSAMHGDVCQVHLVKGFRNCSTLVQSYILDVQEDDLSGRKRWSIIRAFFLHDPFELCAFELPIFSSGVIQDLQT